MDFELKNLTPTCLTQKAKKDTIRKNCFTLGVMM